MPRPLCCRRISEKPSIRTFKPAGTPMRSLEVLTLGMDELEALRLADRDGLYQDAASEQMGISRTTFSRVVASARRKVAEALIDGKALHIGGGVVEVHDARPGEMCGRSAAGGECPKCDADKQDVGLDDRGHGGCRRRREGGRCRNMNAGNQT